MLTKNLIRDLKRQTHTQNQRFMQKESAGKLGRGVRTPIRDGSEIKEGTERPEAAVGGQDAEVVKCLRS